MNDLPKYQRALYKVFYFLQVPRLARFWNRSSVMILCYHGITARPDPDPDDRSKILVTRGLFLAQMRYLIRHYRVISMKDYLAARQNRKAIPPNSVILTFDDGFRNFLTVAAPVLNELNLPATIFLVTDWVEQRNESNSDLSWNPSDDRLSLSWSEAIALRAAEGIEFGSHTCSHPMLPHLSLAEMERELHDSFCAMREVFRDDFVPCLAYPYGGHSDPIAEKARLLGYSCALSTDAGSNSNSVDLYKLRRGVVRRFDTIEVFASRVSGLVSWLRMGRNFFRGVNLPLARVWNSLFY